MRQNSQKKEILKIKYYLIIDTQFIIYNQSNIINQNVNDKMLT